MMTGSSGWNSVLDRRDAREPASLSTMRRHSEKAAVCTPGRRPHPESHMWLIPSFQSQDCEK